MVGNIDTNRAETAALVGESQNAVGAFQTTQVGNQLLAIQPQQLSDLIAVVSANGRAEALSEAERLTTAEQGRIQRERFLAPGAGCQPGKVQMFNNRVSGTTGALRQMAQLRRVSRELCPRLADAPWRFA